jgi:hypothetical protein
MIKAKNKMKRKTYDREEEEFQEYNNRRETRTMMITRREIFGL